MFKSDIQTFLGAFRHSFFGGGRGFSRHFPFFLSSMGGREHGKFFAGEATKKKKPKKKKPKKKTRLVENIVVKQAPKNKTPKKDHNKPFAFLLIYISFITLFF